MDVIFRFQSTCHYIGEVGTFVREEIFLHEVRPFLLPDTVWVVLPFLY